MIIYYRDPTVEVTSAAVNVHRRRFDLTGLEYVWHREVTDPALRPVPSGRSMLNVALIVGAVLGVLGVIYLVTTALGTDEAAAVEVLAPLAAVVVLVGVAGPLLELALHRLDAGRDLGDAVHEIWALWRGRELLLLRLEDEVRFSKIYRSIQKALEQHPR